MKKNLFFTGLAACVFAIGLGLTSCEKETIRQTPVTGTRNPDPRAVPPAGGSLTVGGSCGYIVSCGSIGVYGPKYNMITFSKDISTITHYPTLRYTIYKYAGVIGGSHTYTKIDEFTCNLNTVQYATSLLDNSTSHYLLLNDPTAPPTASSVIYASGIFYSASGVAIPFMTLNLKGGSCVISDPKG